MTDKNGLLETGVLMAYCNNTLDDPDVVKQIRASAECKKWISEHRLVRLLLNSDQTIDRSEDIDEETISRFVDEDLPLDEMKAVEVAISQDLSLLDDYLATRMEHIAERGIAPPKELDERVLSQLLARSRQQAEQAKAVHAHKGDWLEKIRDFFGSGKIGGTPSYAAPFAIFSSGGRLAMAGAFAAVLLVAVISGRQMDLFGGPDMAPIVIAQLDLGEQALTFRGSAQDNLAKAVSSRCSISKVVGIVITEEIAAEFNAYKKRPSRDNIEKLTSQVERSFENQGDQVPDLSTINRLQVSPEFWDQLSEKKSKSSGLARIIAGPTEMCGKSEILVLEKQKSPQTENQITLYLTKIGN